MRLYPSILPAVALAIAVLFAARPGPASAQDADLVIEGATVLAMDGSPPVPDAVVVIRGDRIEAVGPRGAVAVPGGATVVDGTGRWLIPGLWDLHVHALFDADLAAPLLEQLLAFGVTGIRDMGGPLEVLVETRRQVRAGEVRSPRIVASGPVLDGPEPVDPSISWAIGTAGEARDAVDSLAQAGVDFVKVYTMLPREAFFAVADRAAERGLPVAGHVPGEVTPVEAARAGMASIEHLRSEIEPFCARDDPAACARVLESFSEHGVWQTPTLLVRRNRAFLDDSTRVHGPAYRHAPPMLRELWASTRAERLERGDAYFAEARERHRLERWLTGEVHRAGVGLLAGSDAGALFSVHGASLHQELGLLVEAGLSPAEALAAATSEAARFLGTDDSLGTIARGKKADLLLLDGDPLVDIANTRRIRAVVFDGTVLDRAALEGMKLGGSASDSIVDLSDLFGDADATFALLDLETGATVRHGPERAGERYRPASTFKIPNTLIALEEGLVDGPDFTMAWDSIAVPREGFFPDSWARDQTLESAFRNSVYWFYRALAREIGPAAYRDWLARFDYGNRVVGEPADGFWLEGDLAISAEEQVAFLRRLWEGDLPVSDRTREIALELMRVEEGPGHTLYGKTGTLEVTPTRELGWLVGFVETAGSVRAYALNLEGERVWEEWPPGRRTELVTAILARLGVVGSADGALVEKAQAFRARVRAGDWVAARAMAAPEPRRWWESREDEGSPWTIGPGGGPWAAWDEHFRSVGEVVEWRQGARSATVVVRETNDYFRLLERGWVTNEITYFFDDAGRIDGLLIRATGERPPGRTDAFLAWARENAPEEIEALMPDGEIDPSGDHPERFRRLLERWRAEAGLGPVESPTPVESPSVGARGALPAPTLAFADSLLRPIVGVETPGLALLVVRDGAVLHRRAYGTADVATDAPFETATPSYLASVGKMFTAVAVASLIEEGRLAWDDRLGDRLPEAPAYAAGVTLRQMLDHTSGLPDHYDLAGEDRAYSNDEVLEILDRADGLLFEPGTDYAYSNSAYVLLARVVERASGRSLGAFLEERFFDPLGMDDAVVADGTEPPPPDRARGYDASGEGFEPLAYRSTTTGAGGVYASLDDLERWGAALTGGRLLDDATLDVLTTPVGLPDGRPTPWGLGWLAESAGRGPLAGKRYVAAIGDLGGFHAGFQWYLEDGLWMAWIANTNSPEVFDRVIGIPERILPGE